MTRPTALRNVSILLLEDDALISIDTEDMLLSLGAAQVLVAHTVQEAEAIAAEAAIDAAVLDLLIGRTRSEDFAARLLARGVPVIFASGFGDSGLSERLSPVPTVEKPYTAEALRAALDRAFAMTATGGIVPSAAPEDHRPKA